MNALLGVLAESSVRAAVIAAAVACVLSGMRMKSAAFRLCTWTGVLVAMLFLPSFSLWVPRISIALPSGRPGSSTSRIQDPIFEQGPSAKFEEVIPVIPANPDLPGRPQPSSPGGNTNKAASLPRAYEIAAILYVAGFCVLMAGLFLGMLLSYRLFRHAPKDERGFCVGRCAVDHNSLCERLLKVFRLIAPSIQLTGTEACTRSPVSVETGERLTFWQYFGINRTKDSLVPDLGVFS